MKPSTNQCLGHERLSSSGTADVQTATIPKGTSAILVAVETTTARVTLGAGGDPTSTTSLPFYAGQMPWLLLVGQGCTFKFVSSAGTASVVQLAYLT